MAKPLVTNTPTVVHETVTENFRTLLHSMRNEAKKFRRLDEVLEKRKSRVEYCGHALTVESGTVNVVKQTNGNISYNGVASCSNYWRCPVCAYKITQEKGRFLYGLTSNHYEKGGKLGFVTLTMQHNRRDRLHGSLDFLTAKYRAFQQSRWFRNFNKEIEGQVKTVEITFSENNGWHPHLHVLYFYSSETEEAQISDFQKELLKRWVKYLKKHKNQALLRGQDQKVAYSEDIAEYVSKWEISAEMTKGNIKSSKGLTVMTALGKLALQDYEDIKQKRLLQGLYSEFIEATYKKNFITLSPSLRALYADYFEQEEKTDEEICNTSEIAEILLKISVPVWKKVSRLGLQPLLISMYKKPFEAENKFVESLKEDHGEEWEEYYKAFSYSREQLSEKALENVVHLLTRFKALQDICVEIDKNNCPIIL